VLLRLAAGALLLYLPYLLLFGRELLWGTRGLLTVQHAFPLDPLKLLAGLPKYQFKAYTTLLLLVVPAALAARANRRFLALSLAVAVPHLYVILKIPAQDQVFILTTDFFFACWLVIGWRELARHPGGRWLAPLALAGHVALLLVSGSIFRFESHRGYGGELREIARTYLVGRDAVMVTDWSTVRGFSYYVHQAEPGAIDWERLEAQLYDVQNPRRMDPRKLAAAEIYVLDPWRAGPLTRLLRSRRAIEEQASRYSMVGLAGRVLGLRCDPIAESTHRLYRCVRRPVPGPGSPAGGRAAGRARP
ncbi:MAG TPA: hypothetical protein VFU47_11890, partial [Armatimonadota bacterium]|nr:hypothetical protein [Armatimonadota bacterium]